MTARQRVRRALDFETPDRVPRHLWSLPIATREHGRDAITDFQRRWPVDFTAPSGPRRSSNSLVQGNPYSIGTFRDEWGCVLENIQDGVIGEVKMPLLSDYSLLSDLHLPVELLDVDIDAVNRFCDSSDLFVLSSCSARPFERLQFLRGSENLYLDLAEDTSDFQYLLKTVTDFYRDEMIAWSKTKVDALNFMDDWGSQRALLISPDQWRRLFKPIYAEYAQIARDAGKKLFMHTDGHIFDIYEDLIEIGVDAINSQLFCMDIEEIGKRFKGRITFWGEIDRQHILPRATPQQCRAAVAKVIQHLWSKEGGVIAQFELGAGAKIENADAIFRSWDELTFAPT